MIEHLRSINIFPVENKPMLNVLPASCAHSFDVFAALRSVTMGYEREETATGPRKVLGTTPGNSR